MEWCSSSTRYWQHGHLSNEYNAKPTVHCNNNCTLQVQTGGGGTGSFWAHDSWDLDTPPDIVTFSKKMMVGGYYYADHLKIKEVWACV